MGRGTHGAGMAKAKREGRAGKTRRRERPRPGGPPAPAPARPRGGRGLARLRSALDAATDLLLHPRAPAEPVWKLLWPVLALAFAARAAVALSGDFVLHPDEIMQYLEQGHRLAFGNGVLYWEFFYGARSWLIPALIAGVLKLFDAVGLGQPGWYIGGVELTFCAISLLIPAGMYFFARRHFDEAAARAALLAGAFWYELVGLAHKPMTELVATAPLMALLALCMRPPRDDRPAPAAWTAAFLAVLAAAVRLQYAPLALALLGLWLLRAGKAAKMHAAVAAAACIFAVGAFDAITWDAGWFHSYRANLEFNLAIDRSLGWVWPPHQYLVWLAYAGGGLSVLCAAAALLDPRRYGLALLLLALVLLVHSLEAHKEYRFVFVAAPFWLLAGAGVVTRLAMPAAPAALAGRRSAPSSDGRPGSAPGPAVGTVLVRATAGALFAAVSLAGLLNLLPHDDEEPAATIAPPVRYVRGQDPVFAAYRWLADAPGVSAVWHVDRPYHDLPGYYYLHREVPFYDRVTGFANHLHADLEALRGSVSHLVTGDPDLAVPGYAVEREFGGIRILRREEGGPPIRRWRDFTPTITHTYGEGLMRRLYPEAPPPPANFGIRFVEAG